MKIPPDKITCENPYYFGLQNRNQGCNYMYGKLYLFTEKSYFPWNIFKKSYHRQCFYQFSLTKKQCDKLVKPYGKHAESMEHQYSEGTYFPYFSNNDKAVEFCNSKQFAKLVKTLEKLP